MPEVLTQVDPDDSLENLRRELDAAIAERVMGFQRTVTRGIVTWSNIEPPFYSASIEAAMQVVEKMREQNWRVSMMNNAGVEKSDIEWSVDFARGRVVNRLAATLPEAICHAALAAIEAQENKKDGTT